MTKLGAVHLKCFTFNVMSRVQNHLSLVTFLPPATRNSLVRYIVFEFD